MCRLCIVFLTFSCIGYAMPFILCATICCCLPCIISILGFREDLSQNRGATPESINSLPTYKFKVKKNKSKENGGAASEGGIVAAGTEKERMISGEDAVRFISFPIGLLLKYWHNVTHTWFQVPPPQKEIENKAVILFVLFFFLLCFFVFFFVVFCFFCLFVCVWVCVCVFFFFFILKAVIVDFIFFIHLRISLSLNTEDNAVLQWCY